MKQKKKLSAKDTAHILIQKAESLSYPVIRIERSVLLRETGRKNLTAKFIIALDDALHAKGWMCGWRTKQNVIIDQWGPDFNVAVLYYSRHEEYIQKAILLEDWKDNNVALQREQEYADGLLLDSSQLSLVAATPARNPTRETPIECIIRRIRENSRYGARGDAY